MATLARDVLERAQIQIMDDTGVRWPLPELCMWLNDGQREVAIHKPSAAARSVVLPLVAGTRQTIPAGDLQMLRVYRNLARTSTDTNRIGDRAVRQVDRTVLDATHPDWHDARYQAPLVKHFVFDEADPTAFYVYPGNDGTGAVEAVIATSPAALPTAGETLADYARPLSLPEIYANALLDYVLYRAYAKDASFAANAQRSADHYQAFAASLGIKAVQEASAGPQGESRP